MNWNILLLFLPSLVDVNETIKFYNELENIRSFVREHQNSKLRKLYRLKNLVRIFSIKYSN